MLPGISGPLLFLIIITFIRPEGLSEAGIAVLGITVWMALWWIFEVTDIAVTALLPIVLFPLTGAVDISATTASYGHKYIFLYMGGFFLAIAIEKWNLHRRIALNIIYLVGSNISRIVLGFMLATAFMSMWISNTATSVMMLPIALAIIAQVKDHPETPEDEKELFGKMILLSIAYSASIGGMATLFGTPPNLVFAGNGTVWRRKGCPRYTAPPHRTRHRKLPPAFPHPQENQNGHRHSNSLQPLVRRTCRGGNGRGAQD